MNDETRVVEAPARPQLMPVVDTGEFAQLLDSDRFAQIQRVAKLFSESDLVPAVFQGKPANCAVALQMAFRMRVDPMMLMQNMYIIKGRPGIEAKLAIALINSRGPFKGPVQWRFDGEGDGRTCYAYAVHAKTGEKCEASVSWAMVKAEGWLTKDGSKWRTMPEIMFQYRSAMFLGRLYCPEVLLGLPSADELHDTEIEVEGTAILRRPDRPIIPMPQAREPIDVGTGAGPGAAGMASAASETGPGDAQKDAEPLPPTEAPPGVSGSDPSALEPVPKRDPVADAMQRPASEAQKRAIEATGKRLGLSPEQIGEIVADATGFALSTMPQGAVNAALGAIAKHGKA